jgi:hypothetical protein
MTNQNSQGDLEEEIGRTNENIDLSKEDGLIPLGESKMDIDIDIYSRGDHVSAIYRGIAKTEYNQRKQI